MSNRLQSDVNRAFKKAVRIRDQYMVLFTSNTRPWSKDTKIKLESKLQVLQDSQEDLQRFIEKWEEHAKRIKDPGQKEEEFDKYDAWRDNEDHADMIEEIAEILLQGKRYLYGDNSDISNHSINISSSQNSIEPKINSTFAKIPALNIQKFDGNYLNYNTFWQRFKYLVHENPYPKVEKLITLYGLLDGKALKAVDGFQMVEENYDTVVQILSNRFGNQNMILQELHTKLRSIQRAKPRAESMRDTVDAINKICRELKNFGVNIDNDSTRLDIIDKMPPNEKDELSFFNISNPRPSTDMILEKMESMVMKAEIADRNRSLENAQASSSYHQNFFKTQSFDDSSVASLTNEKSKPFNNYYGNSSNKRFVCSLCNENQYVIDCTKFVSAEEKVNQLKIQNGCTRCAGRNHVAYQCRADVQCQKCNGDHRTFLCQSKNDSKVTKPSTTNAMVSIGAQQGCLLTKRITVMNPNTKEAVDATVFFDSGSQKSYVRDQLIDQLKLPQEKKERLNLQGIGAKATNYISSLVKLQIKTAESHEEIFANSIRNIADSVPVMKSNGKFDPRSFTVSNHPPDILIGMDYFFQFISSFEKRNEYVIVHSKVGQMLSSNIPVLPQGTISAFAINSKRLYNYDDKAPNLLKMSAMGNPRRSNASKQGLERFKTRSTNALTFFSTKIPSFKQHREKTEKEKAPRTFERQKHILQSSHQPILLPPKINLNQRKNAESESLASTTSLKHIKKGNAMENCQGQNTSQSSCFPVIPTVIQRESLRKTENENCHGQYSSQRNKAKNEKVNLSRKHRTFVKSEIVTHQRNETKASKLGGGEGLMEVSHNNKRVTVWRSIHDKSTKTTEAVVKSNNQNSSVRFKTENKLLKGWVTKNPSSSKELYNKSTPHSEGSNVNDSND